MTVSNSRGPRRTTFVDALIQPPPAAQLTDVSHQRLSRSLQEAFPAVPVKDLPLLARFLEYATETVDYAQPGTPTTAISFAALGHFFDDAELIAVLDTTQQSQLIDEIRPPPGRHATWTDFLTILQIVADTVHPTIHNEALALELVCRGAMEKLRALDVSSAARMHTTSDDTDEKMTVIRHDQAGSESAAPASPAAAPPVDSKTTMTTRAGDVSPPTSGEVVDTALAGGRRGVASVGQLASITDVAAAAPLPHSRYASTCKSSGGLFYRPQCLTFLAERVTTFMESARVTIIRSISDVETSPSAEYVRRQLLQMFIDTIAPLSPRPCRVHALQITFQGDAETALQLADALSDLIASVPVISLHDDFGRRSLSCDFVCVDEDILWRSVQSCGAVLFPTSPPIAQEELGLQVFLNAMGCT
jgi:hypothetical protein